MFSLIPEATPLEASGGRPRTPSLGVRTLSGFGWSSLTVVIKALLTFLVLAILSRLLTPNDFGLVGIAWILIELATRFGQTGIGHALIQRHELTDRHLEIGFTLSTVLGGAIAGSIWLFAPRFGHLFDEPTVSSLLRVLSVTLVIGGVGVVPEHLLRRNLRFKELMVADLLSYLAGYGLTATVLAFQGFGAWALVLGEIVRVLIRTVTTSLYFPPSPRLRPAVREATDLISRGAGYSLTQVFDFIVRTGGYFVVGRWLGATALGYYTRADRLASLPLQYLGGNLFEVIFPAMARRQQRGDLVRAAYLHGVEMLALAVLPVSALVLLCAPGIVAVVLGRQWDETIPVLRILALGIPFQTIGILNVAALRASGAVSKETWRQAAHASFVISAAWLGSHWGLKGVAVALVGTQVVACLLMTQAALSILELDLRRLLRCCLPALWSSGWTAFALWLVTGQFQAWELSAGAAISFEILLWAIGIVATTYCAPSWARLWSVPWALAHVPFEDMGTLGRYVRNGLGWLPAPRDASQ